MFKPIWGEAKPVKALEYYYITDWSKTLPLNVILCGACFVVSFCTVFTFCVSE